MFIYFFPWPDISPQFLVYWYSYPSFGTKMFWNTTVEANIISCCFITFIFLFVLVKAYTSILTWYISWKASVCLVLKTYIFHVANLIIHFFRHLSLFFGFVLVPIWVFKIVSKDILQELGSWPNDTTLLFTRAWDQLLSVSVHPAYLLQVELGYFI